MKARQLESPIGMPPLLLLLLLVELACACCHRRLVACACSCVALVWESVWRVQ